MQQSISIGRGGEGRGGTGRDGEGRGGEGLCFDVVDGSGVVLCCVVVLSVYYFMAACICLVVHWKIRAITNGHAGTLRTLRITDLYKVDILSIFTKQ